MASYAELNVPTRRSHWVYRLWAADGTCLYVGMTSGVCIRRRAELSEDELLRRRELHNAAVRNWRQKKKGQVS